MKICNNCYSSFSEEESDVICDRFAPYETGYGRDRYETMCCPYCGSDDLGEAGVCDVCGECVPDDYITLVGSKLSHRICNGCKAETMKKLDIFVNTEMTDVEKQFLVDEGIIYDN